MKIVLFFTLFFSSLAVYSAPKVNERDVVRSINHLKTINKTLLSSDDEAEISLLLDRRLVLLDDLMRQLRVVKAVKLTTLLPNKDLFFLESRIKINRERGHLLAAQRDIFELETQKVDFLIKNYLEYLIESSKSYLVMDEIITASQHLLNVSIKKKEQKYLPHETRHKKLATALKENQQYFLYTTNTYQSILSYVINNPRKIASIHWFQEFSVLSSISYINQFELFRPINQRLALLKVDVGGIIISLLIFNLVYFSYPFIFKFTSWYIENYLIDREDDQQALIYHQIRTPLRGSLIFFGLNLGANALFYKTDYKISVEGFSFIIYSLFCIWLLFKMIDSFVLVKIQKLSNSNSTLRKEIFNLAVQSTKGIVLIVILAFGLNHFGISLTAIISTLGVGGLAFALAAKDTLSNLFGGITILFDNIFRMGDWVKIGDAEGTVSEIGLRSTTIRTFDNALITIPNSLISISSVRNWNRRAVGRRIKMYVGVTYESDMEDLKQSLQDIRDMLFNHPDIANSSQKHTHQRKRIKMLSHEDDQGIKATQLVFLDRYNDFSIDILVYCFSKTVNWAEWLAVKEDVLFQIAEILAKNNLEFAYPTEVRINREDIGI